MKPSKSTEKYREILEKRVITKEFEELTSKFDLNTDCALMVKNFYPSPEENTDGFGYIQKLHKVFDLSNEFKTLFLRNEDFFAAHAYLHAVSKNGYLYIRHDGYWDIDLEYSSDLTENFIQDICRVFEQYYGKQVSFKLENSPIGGESIWLVITPTEEQ